MTLFCSGQLTLTAAELTCRDNIPCEGGISRSDEREPPPTVSPFRGLTRVNNLFIFWYMITSFANKETEKLFATGKSKKLPAEIIARSIMRLTQLDNAREIMDLLIPPSNRLEALSGDRAGQWSIRINDQWRICFVFANGEATDVEIVDYH